jgi:hypothetical protein
VKVSDRATDGTLSLLLGRAPGAPPASHNQRECGANYTNGGSTTLYVIELTRGTTWRHSADQIDRRECQTENINAAIAEARHWLLQVQKEQPHRGATHYRVISPSGNIVEGP